MKLFSYATQSENKLDFIFKRKIVDFYVYKKVDFLIYFITSFSENKQNLLKLLYNVINLMDMGFLWIYITKLMIISIQV